MIRHLHSVRSIRFVRNFSHPAALIAALGIAQLGCAHHNHDWIQNPPAPPVTTAAEMKPVDPPPAPAPAVAADRIEIPGELQFVRGSARIASDEESQRVLAELAHVLETRTEITKLRVEGHTDDSGSDRTNQRLSQARADAVARWLVTHGVDANRVEAMGYGASRPITDNSDAEGRARNRRTEFHVAELNGKPYDAKDESTTSVAR